MSGVSPVPLFRAVVPELAQARAAAALRSGWIGYGPECRELEGAFTARRGGWALATTCCTASLYLAGRLLADRARGERPEIVVPSLSFVASGMAFLQAGVTPVLADVRQDDLTLDAAAAERAITPRTRAILVVHLYGQRARDLDALRALADRRGLVLIEDCAHRVDLLDAAAPVGDIACYSFNAVKEIPCGEGGLLWGRDASFEDLARAVSNLGLAVDTPQRASSLRHADYAFEPVPGLKLRMSDVAAAIANGCIPSLASTRAKRRALLERYARLLAPLAPAVRMLERRDDDSFLMAVVRLPAPLRDGIRSAMARAGIATSVHYPSLSHHPLFGDPQARGAHCCDADLEVTTLPSWLGMDAADQQRVVDALSAALDAVTAQAGTRRATPAT
ncbi:UDP-4-amino-4-deoxy-L-arabinose-oxoglutarate aminotransferase [Burkholderiales bacterium]|nr:UDP-4-amino-4-deoxy-L-arabinose-oxoglutarate aminotransferase [Burkholderiales bacterium]